MTEDVKRVARAAFMASESRNRAPVLNTDLFDWQWKTDATFRQHWSRIAVASIAALMEPSAAMRARHGRLALAYYQEVLDSALGEWPTEPANRPSVVG